MIHPAIQLTQKVWQGKSREIRRLMKINLILVAFLILSASAVAQQIADSPSTEASLASSLPDAPSSLGAQNTAPQKNQAQPPPDALGTLRPMGFIAPVPPPMTNARLTLDDKFRIYTHQAFGPPALVFPAIGAAFRMANPPNNYPQDWTDGWGAFGRLYGSTIATQTSKRSAQFLTEVILHEDPRYLPARPGSNVGERVFHAISYTFVDRTDSGARTIAFSNFAGAASGGFVGMAYLPDGFKDPTHAGQRALSEFMTIGIANLAGEFAPELAPIVRKLHIPKIVPTWWVPEHSQRPY
jgi:hypothetical protein